MILFNRGLLLLIVFAIGKSNSMYALSSNALFQGLKQNTDYRIACFPKIINGQMKYFKFEIPSEITFLNKAASVKKFYTNTGLLKKVNLNTSFSIFLTDTSGDLLIEYSISKIYDVPNLNDSSLTTQMKNILSSEFYLQEVGYRLKIGENAKFKKFCINSIGLCVIPYELICNKVHDWSVFFSIIESETNQNVYFANFRQIYNYEFIADIKVYSRFYLPALKKRILRLAHSFKSSMEVPRNIIDSVYYMNNEIACVYGYIAN